MKIPGGTTRIQSGNAPTVNAAPPESSSGCITAEGDSDRMAP
jgi:hypothetical protein